MKTGNNLGTITVQHLVAKLIILSVFVFEFCNRLFSFSFSFLPAPDRLVLFFSNQNIG